MKSILRKIISPCCVAAMIISTMLLLGGCGKKSSKVIIYTSMEDYRVEYLNKRIKETFPDYDIIVEYMSTGSHAAKLLAEGTKTDCDISYNLEYGYLQQLDNDGVLADLSSYDQSGYMDDVRLSSNFLVQERNGGAIIINTKVLADKGLSEPTCYEDLLKPEYKGLISMPSPKASGTGYMFLKSLVNYMGEEETLAYFDKLTENILSYTSSGSGPLNALLQGEVAIGLGMTAPAVTEINNNEPLKLIFLDPGSPYSLYGQAMIKGKENNETVKEVFDWLVNVFTMENHEFYFPEKIYKEVSFSVKNYPENINYADMSNNTVEEKSMLLEKWKY